MLRLDPLKLIQQFRRPGGADFAGFVSELIRTICWEQGVPASAVSTCARTDARDGGVDARVGQACPVDKTGYFLSTSIWQFKAADEANVTAADMPKEVAKPHARSCIENGHAYRLCICDHLTDEKKTDLKNALRKAIQAIKPDAPEPSVLDVDDLAALANRYPAIMMMLEPSLALASLHLNAWAHQSHP